MFERFTERAREVVQLAQKEARGLKHNYIGSEHVLLGIMREDEGLAAQTLKSLGFTIEKMREEIISIVGMGEDVMPGQIPFTPRAKKGLENALREALTLGHTFIGTEHILLGLIRADEDNGVAGKVLSNKEAVRATLLGKLSGSQQGITSRPVRPKQPVFSRGGTAERMQTIERLRAITQSICDVMNTLEDGSHTWRIGRFDD